MGVSLMCDTIIAPRKLLILNDLRVAKILCKIKVSYKLVEPCFFRFVTYHLHI